MNCQDAVGLNKPEADSNWAVIEPNAEFHPENHNFNQWPLNI